MYRFREGGLQVFLVHPGGPYWVRKDLGAWMIPKGEYGPREEPLEAARREFEEETGTFPKGEFKPLEPIRQSGGKLVRAWALEGDIDPDSIRSNTFSLEWPPRSGRTREFPEVDRAGWFSLKEAEEKILPSQAGLLKQLEKLVGDSGP